jgi:lipopolysaccharide export system permease protein
MKILGKYVLRDYVLAFFLCIILLIVLGIIGDILGFLDDIFKNHIPLQSILAFYFYLAPFAFVNMVPFACLLSAVYVFNSLSKNHEVTAVITSGLSLWTLIRPILMVTLLFCLATFIINDKCVPPSMQKAARIRQEDLERSGEKKKFEIKDIAIFGKGDQLIFAKSYEPLEKTLNNLIIHKQDEQHDVTRKISARTAKWDRNNIWKAEDVIVFDVDKEGKFSRDPVISKKRDIVIAERPEDFAANQWDPRFMSFKQLKDHIKLFNIGSKSTIRRLLVDLNYKIAFPFTALITVLVGIPFSIETGRASALIGMARGIGVAVLYLPIMAVSLALGKNGALPPVVAAWLSIILFGCLGVYYVNKKS